jgi:hypothetical protein
MPTFSFSSLKHSTQTRSASLLRSALLVGSAAIITACGGGGGGGGSDSPAAPATPIKIAAPYSQFIITGSQTAVDLSGKFDGESLKGGGTINFSAAVPATFEGINGMRSTMTISVIAQIDGDSYPIPPISNTSYYDGNYREVGGIFMDGSYSVVTVAHDLPLEAKAGDSGELYAYTAYSGPSKIAVMGSAASSYHIEKDSSNSVILRISIKYYNSAKALTETDDYRYRITAAGVINFISLETLSADGSEKFEFNVE